MLHHSRTVSIDEFENEKAFEDARPKGRLYSLDEFLKYIKDNILNFKRLPLEAKRDHLNFIFSKVAKDCELNRFLTPDSMDQWAYCQACLHILRTEPYEDDFFIAALEKLYNESSDEGLKLLCEYALEDNESLVNLLHSLSDQNRILFIRHLATLPDKLAELISNQDEYNNLCQLIPEHQQDAFLQIHRESCQTLIKKLFKEAKIACELDYLENSLDSLDTFFKFMQVNLIHFNLLPIQSKKRYFEFLFSKRAEFFEDIDFSIPGSMDQWAYCRACLYLLRTEEFNENFFIQKYKELNNRSNCKGLRLLYDNTLKNNASFVNLLRSLSDENRILFIIHLDTFSENLAELISNQKEFNNIYKLIPKHHQGKFKKLYLNLKQKLLEEYLETKEPTQLHYPLNEKRKALLDRWCFYKALLQNPDNIKNDDIETLHLPEWKEEYGLDSLKAVKAIDFRRFMENAPAAIQLDLIKYVGANHLHKIIKDVVDLAIILDSINPSNHRAFLTLIGQEFINKLPFCYIFSDRLDKLINHIDRAHVDRQFADDIIKNFVNGIIRYHEYNTEQAAKYLDKFSEENPELRKKLLCAAQRLFRERLDTEGSKCLPCCSMFSQKKIRASNRLLDAVTAPQLHPTLDLSKFEKFLLTSDKFDGPIAKRLLRLAP